MLEETEGRRHVTDVHQVGPERRARKVTLHPRGRGPSLRDPGLGSWWRRAFLASPIGCFSQSA